MYRYLINTTGISYIANSGKKCYPKYITQGYKLYINICSSLFGLPELINEGDLKYDTQHEENC